MHLGAFQRTYFRICEDASFTSTKPFTVSIGIESAVSWALQLRLRSLCVFGGLVPSTSFCFASASCVSASASFWDLLRLLVVVYGVVLAQSFTRWQSLSLNLRWLLDVSDGYNLVWVPHLSSSIFILASFVCEAFHPLLPDAHSPSGVSSLPSFLFAVK